MSSQEHVHRVARLCRGEAAGFLSASCNTSKVACIGFLRQFKLSVVRLRKPYHVLPYRAKLELPQEPYTKAIEVD